MKLYAAEGLKPLLLYISNKLARGTGGPVRDLSVDIEYSDVELAAGQTFEHVVPMGSTVFAYVVDESIETRGKEVKNGQCAVFGEGDLVKLFSKDGARFLFVSGEPLKEPVAWRGPIVMNTEEELDRAFKELDDGTFIKSHKPAKLE